MAERNPRTPHSIESLIFVNRNGKYCGYKQELIIDNISADLREFLICAECKGVTRRARQGGGSTVCEMCVPQERRDIGDIDERVEYKVTSLNAKCPLSKEGCCWEGRFGEIEKHMKVCRKVIVECQLKCGILFEREYTEQHIMEVCPLRMKRCEFCNEEVQAKEENRHIGECQYHPDTEVPCPYKELGCEAIVLRKNMNTHITENMDSHHLLMLNQLKQLRNIITKSETTTTTTERGREYSVGRKKCKNKLQLCVILTLIAVLLGVMVSAIIGIAVIESLGNSIRTNSEQISYLKDSSLYSYEYIRERRKFLLGIEWRYDLQEIGTLSGPTFYLGQCRLRLKAEITNYRISMVYARYYVERLE